MNTLHIEYPDSLPDASRQSREALEREMRMALAAKLFELGRLSSGQAAQIAGVSRYAFLHDLSAFRVHAIDWDPDEFEAELDHA